MTERILPSIALPIPVRRQPHREADAGPVARPDRPAARTRDAILDTRTRAGMLFGASTVVCAVSLAGVAMLQSQSDAAIAARRAPHVEAVAAAQAANDILEATLLDLDAQARALASDYAAVGEDVAGYQARLDELAALVADVQGSVAALPTRISLPTVTMRGPVGGSGTVARAPATTVSSGASGAP